MSFFRQKIEKTKEWAIKNERYLSPLFFFGGVVLDNLTLSRIDRLYDNIVLFSYLILAITTIILINLFQSKEIENKWTRLLPLITQFAFGGLFSGYAIFYTKSGSFATSWIFLIIIYGIFVANERFRKYYERIDFQLKILFVAIFSYLIFFIPIVTKTIGSFTFIASGLISLAIIYALLVFFFKYISSLGARREKRLMRNIFYIYFVFNILYFTNIIPPIPLSIKHLEVYNYVEKIPNGNYIVREEKLSWLDFHKDWLNKIDKTPKAPVYVFASVFAPTDLNTEITHIWQRFDELNNEWVTVNEVVYPIFGGREGGYRGYTLINNAPVGHYRVFVKNVRGQTLGKINFDIEEVSSIDLESREI